MNTEKIATLTAWINAQKLSGAILTNFHSISYLTGFESDPIERVLALVILSDHEPFLFGPALEVHSMTASGWPFPAFGYEDQENPWQKLAQHIKNATYGQSFAIEADHLTLSRFQQLQEAYPTASFNIDITDQINRLRLIKTAAEIQHMIAAGRDADRAFNIGFNALTTGVSELDVVATIEYELKKSGVSAMSFETLLQFGQHAADPHGATSTRTLKSGDMALFDLGTMSEGYASDATRTVAFGNVDAKAREIHAITLEAQLTAQSHAKIGMTADELDAIARHVITKAGYGQYFVHRLGHGLGSSVHEFPSIMAGNDVTLQEGMAFSIEPGIYIPGIAGVRIEDSGYMSRSGFVPFTHTPKDLLQF
ncbi:MULTISPECIES: Xaa-Pro peptidase family protein [Leuconostoc]|uniref:Aminopeptidase P family protein n=1 Tax=Leuconostoc kimchii TaxID=136609 RepID=A0ABX5SIM6_9LACO|nr:MULTISPECIES: Xaa-Pro peptidase family protein [Leuconostoc]AEJ30110.1 Xaa-Pro dipeptidase [Leuconostoc sp. C2]QBR47199.1 aminopeptidase P family protein [Leuconostoc kimchii]